MGKILAPVPVKLFIGILASDISLFRIAEKKLSSVLGTIDLKTADEGIPFTFTDYYTTEMGTNLKRFFLSFEKLIKPDEISGIKIRANELEETVTQWVDAERHGAAAPKVKSPVSRPINLDPGYLTTGKVILATTKDYAHRIYVKDGIYAEVTLQYRSGQESTKGFQPMPWTYPDYRTKEYLDFFERMRKIYLNQTR